jgi:hypothetical protein
MHDAHVKCKENPMNRYVMEEFHNNPALLQRLMGEAHRNRSRAIGSALGSALAWLLRQLKHLAPRLHFRPSRWIARLG